MAEFRSGRSAFARVDNGRGSEFMRTSTRFCAHGFLVPGLPEPWVVPISKGGVERRISRFCRECWEENCAVFFSFGYEQPEPEDPLQYGFNDLIQSVLQRHGPRRDASRLECLETELRMHLMARREEIERVAQEKPEQLQPYVRVILRNKLRDLQKTREAKLERKSTSFEDETFGLDTTVSQDWEPEDENQLAASLIEANEANDADRELREDGGVGTSSRGPISSVKGESNSSTSSARRLENAELHRNAIGQQEHRLDGLTRLIQREDERELRETYATSWQRSEHCQKPSAPS